MADGFDLTPEERDLRMRRAQEIRERRARERKIRRGQRRWRTFMAVYSVLFLLLGAAGCFLLYRYADAYEASIPEHVMDGLMRSTSQEEWHDYIRQGVALPDSPYEDSEAIFEEYYNTAIRDKSLTYWKYMDEYTANTPVYKVRGGGLDLCLVRLIPKGHNAAGFGRQLWQLGEVESILKLNNLESVTLEIDAPHDQTVYLNGVAVTADYLTDQEVPAPDMTPLEKRFTVPPTFSRYRIENMYGDIEVTDADGRVLPPNRDPETGVLRYVARESDLHSFVVQAPETLTVRVNGAVLTEEDAIRVDDGVLTRLSAYTGGKGYKTLTFSFDGLYSEPEITAVDARGTELTPLVDPKGKLYFFPPNNNGLAVKVKGRVEEFFQRYIDYSSRAFNAGRHNALLECILPDSDLYKYVRDSRDAMIWASATEVHYDELEFTNFCPVGDSCFTCTIRYKADFQATTWHNRYSYDLQNAYELSFVRRDGVWYAAAMSAIGS